MGPYSTRASALLLLSMLVAFADRQVAAQPQEAGNEGAGDAAAFAEVVHVDIVNIDVWVTDRQGQPVPGLEADDFVVIRDGEPIPITNFYAVENGRERRSTPPASPGPDRPAAAALPTLAPEHQLWLILYVDNYNIDPIDRRRVFPALRQFLGQTLRAGDQAMIVTYDRSLEVRQPFTADVHLLYDSLDEIAGESGHAVVRKREQRETLERIDKTRDAGQALIYARQYAEEQMNGIEYTTEALDRLIESLGGLPGRKALVHVSSGVPMAAGEEMFHAVAEKFNASEPYGQIARHDTSRSFERVNRHANAQRVAFYTVDAGGLRGMEFGNAEYAGFVDMRLRSTLDSVVPEMLQAPLRLMALETGGQAILNQNDILPALERSAQDFRSFYSLGIAAVEAEKGRYHEIEVKLRQRRRGVRLRHRGGYRGKSLDTRVRESLRAALLYAHEENPLGVEIRWGRAERQGKNDNYLLPIQLHVPLRDVVLLPTSGGRHEARLQLFVGAVGKDGGTSEIDSAPFGLRLSDEHVEAARKESLVHTHKLLVSKGRRRIGVAVLDRLGQETSVVVGLVQIGPPDRDGG